MIQELINKQDNFEIIRDQIALILATESANQQQLAIDAGEDPSLWKLRVFTERSNPWEQLLNEQTDRSPIVNVWFDNANYDNTASNIVERQKTEAIYNIDCYGYGIAADEAAGGHKPGDKEAAFEVHRCLRLVRNILMASTYTYLELQGLVWRRNPQSVTVFQPALDARQIQQIVGARLAFSVMFNEFSPQFVAQELELVSVQVNRSETGEILMETDFDFGA